MLERRTIWGFCSSQKSLILYAGGSILGCTTLVFKGKSSIKFIPLFKKFPSSIFRSHRTKNWITYKQLQSRFLTHSETTSQKVSVLLSQFFAFVGVSSSCGNEFLLPQLWSHPWHQTLSKVTRGELTIISCVWQDYCLSDGLTHKIIALNVWRLLIKQEFSLFQCWKLFKLSRFSFFLRRKTIGDTRIFYLVFQMSFFPISFFVFPISFFYVEIVPTRKIKRSICWHPWKKTDTAFDLSEKRDRKNEKRDPKNEILVSPISFFYVSLYVHV